MIRKTLAIVAVVMFGTAITGGTAVARGVAHVAKYSQYHDDDCQIPNYLRIMTDLCSYNAPSHERTKR
jgi:hypothetical protein